MILEKLVNVQLIHISQFKEHVVVQLLHANQDISQKVFVKQNVLMTKSLLMTHALIVLTKLKVE
jgi:hypothetical protein